MYTANVGESENRHKADTWNSASAGKGGNTADSMDKNNVCRGTSSDGHQANDFYLLITWSEKQIREEG